MSQQGPAAPASARTAAPECTAAHGRIPCIFQSWTRDQSIYFELEHFYIIDFVHFIGTIPERFA
jgi:hypothetical protein